MKAVWKDQIIAESNDTVVVEGNHYFPASAVNQAFVRKSDHTTICPWKGTAAYYDVVVDGACNNNAAWYYPQTKEKAKEIEGRVAFWRGVNVVD